jgi:hypothetical protein
MAILRKGKTLDGFTQEAQRPDHLYGIGLRKGTRVYVSSIRPGGGGFEGVVYAGVDPALLGAPRRDKTKRSTYEAVDDPPVFLTKRFVAVVDDMGRSHYCELGEVSRV